MLLRYVLTGLALAALVLTTGCTTCGKHGGCCGSVSSAPPCCGPGGVGGPPPGAVIGP
jgi:hypothetical protein